MKTLVVYYSRTGHTRAIARELADALSADVEEIRELKSRAGLMGGLSAGKDATLRKTTAIEPAVLDPSIYDLVIIGTPVWVFTMASGVRTWLTEYGKDLKKVAFFASMGGKGDQRTFAHMEQLCGQAPIATATFIDKEIATGEYQDQLKLFIKNLI